LVRLKSSASPFSKACAETQVNMDINKHTPKRVMLLREPMLGIMRQITIANDHPRQTSVAHPPLVWLLWVGWFP
jgi:hypothetical protein